MDQYYFFFRLCLRTWEETRESHQKSAGIRRGRWPTISGLCFGVVFAVWQIVIFDTVAADKKTETLSSRQLIETLRSPNRAPTWPDGDIRSEPPYPAEYDHRAQDHVFDAWNALLLRGSDVFPELLKHLDDTEYSCTIKGGMWKNIDVGGVCKRILFEQVEIYTNYIRFERERFRRSWISRGYGMPSNEAIREWWAKNKGRSLHDLQLEATNWAIAYEEAKGFSELEEQDGEKARVLGGLKRLRTRLQASNKPIQIDWKGHFLGEDKEYEEYSPPSPPGNSKAAPVQDNPFGG